MTPPPHSLPLRRLFPNMITLGALCCGLTSIRYALSERWELAVTLLLIAALLDGLDGRVARLLKASSEFGAQLDSLSDFVCFGVAPGVLMYLWSMHDIKGIGWAAVLFYASCAAMRLARFNTGLSAEKKQPWQEQFFTGVPSPAGAMLCVTPLVLSFEFSGGFFDAPKLVIPYVILVGMLMVSRIPTFSMKKIRIEHRNVLPLMLAFVLYVTLAVVEPWMMFWVTTGGYICTLPLSFRRYQRLRAASPQP